MSPTLIDDEPMIARLWRERVETPLGPMVALASEDALLMLEYDEPGWVERQGRALKGSEVTDASNQVTREAARQLAAYFSGDLTTFDLPLRLVGTEFQRAVWTALLAIPYGRSRSYSQLAKELGKEGSSRAVGGANGDNRLAIVVPCHRVIRADGNLCGYAGGLWRKQRLLALESGQPPLL